MTARRMPWKWIAIVWVLALALGAATGVAMGYLNGPEPGPELPSPDQQRVLAELGDPTSFFVGDGPFAEGGDWHRIEVWAYPKDGVEYEFFDGVLTERRDSTAGPDDQPTTFSPADFGREHTRAEIEALLGEEGAVLDRSEGMWDGLEPVGYPGAGLAVGYLDGRLYLVETF